MSGLPKKKTRTHPGNNLLTSLLLVFPLLIFYQLGVLVSPVMNGADFITAYLMHLAGVRGYLYIQGALLVSYLGVVLYLRRQQEFNLRIFLPVILESGIYALTMGTLIVFTMVDLLGIDPRLAAGERLAGAGILDRLLIAAGAGVHEELLFRLGLLGGITAFCSRVLGLRRTVCLLLAFGVSSLLFSAAHHVGPQGDALRLGVFVYRTLAGLFFASLYQFRGFAVAVYTHTIYDIYVLLLH